MLIMEPVNACDKTLPVLQELRMDVKTRMNPLLLLLSSLSSRSLSATLSLTLNYHYWALGTESSLLHLSDVGH